MDVDVEVGGTDQTFNMLTGRTLLKALKGKEKFVITCPFLMGTDGEKMSKSTGNYISLRDEPFEMYRKVMTIHDDMVVHYFDMVLGESKENIKEKKEKIEKGTNPMEIKKELAFEIVTWLYDEARAKAAQTEFEDVVQKGEEPSEMPSVKASQLDSFNIVDILASQNIVKSKSQVRRLIDQNAIRINEETVIDYNEEISDDAVYLIQVGKGRWLRIEPN